MHLPLHAHENPATPVQVVTVISGTVQDEKGNVLAGATVSVKGYPNLGTTTDGNGRFSLRISDNVNDPVLVISYVGFQSQAIAIGKRTSITVQLESDNKALNEVVVVGFGQQKLPTVTGEISVVDSKALLQTPVANITNMLIGRAAGISGIQNSGEPGQNATTIRIRGISTLNGSDPLIVIDGIQQPTEQPYTVLNAMDPNEIDNISILKDASATAVFGIRGANGRNHRYDQTRSGQSSSIQLFDESGLYEGFVLIRNAQFL
ncbi:carboxypeptidase-like regulatory domain-containing protein [Siphonobacter sp. BAB-5385]|uniref:carboxypeptidase-like regulatory domain-containing protein n=1 Tax=Siphonobacter sp. BAB-5385 TaxID=1864822 RepID=UPI0015959CDC|nr:carboxypeptidase-like regulatory domain-containing protein [Siphonobacter sp. BAB-5385]